MKSRSEEILQIIESSEPRVPIEETTGGYLYDEIFNLVKYAGAKRVWDKVRSRIANDIKETDFAFDDAEFDPESASLVVTFHNNRDMMKSGQLQIYFSEKRCEFRRYDKTQPGLRGVPIRSYQDLVDNLSSE
jgi:hypothetical protein